MYSNPLPCCRFMTSDHFWMDGRIFHEDRKLKMGESGIPLLPPTRSEVEARQHKEKIIQARKQEASKDGPLQQKITLLHEKLADMAGLIQILYSFEDVGGSGFINRSAFERFVAGAMRCSERARRGVRVGDKAREPAVMPVEEAVEVSGRLFDALDEKNRGEVECVELANRSCMRPSFPYCDHLT